MAEPIVVQIALAVIPLESYWAMLPAEGRPELKELQRRARAGTLPGACKQKGRDWYINQIAAMQAELSEPNGESEEPDVETEEGNGVGKTTKRKVPRKVEDRRKRRVWGSS